LTKNNQSEIFPEVLNGTIHRILTDGNGGGAFDFARHNPHLMCKFRHMRWWSMNEDLNTKDKFDSMMDYWAHPKDSRRGVKPLPYMGDTQTAAYFFVHSQLTLPPIKKKKKGPISDTQRKAFMLSKDCEVKKEVMTALLNANFEVHLTCKRRNYHQYNRQYFPEKYHTKIIDHGRLSPNDFGMMLRDMSAVIGLGEPRESPTPYEALANGAAFLNAINGNGIAQSSILQHLGKPYVFNYNRSEDVDVHAENIVKAVEEAMKHSFSSFIPYENKYESVVSQLCSNLIEDDALCEMLEDSE